MRNLIAILRGITRAEIEQIAEILLNAGITKIEVPLNSPNAFASIETLIKNFDGQGIFGAGTVLTTEDVKRLADIGAQMVVSPHCNIAVIQQTKKQNMLSYPGVMTPTECFTALEYGADGLKFFPGDIIGANGIKAMRAVLPSDTNCMIVGGAHIGNFAEFRQAGANGFGIGSALYQAGEAADAVAQKAQAIVKAYDDVMQ